MSNPLLSRVLNCTKAIELGYILKESRCKELLSKVRVFVRDGLCLNVTMINVDYKLYGSLRPLLFNPTDKDGRHVFSICKDCSSVFLNAI